MFENEYKMDIRRYQRWTTPIFYKVLSFWPWLFIFLLSTVGAIIFYKNDLPMRWKSLALMLMLISVYRSVLFRPMLAGKQFKLMRVQKGKKSWDCKVVVGNTIRLFEDGEFSNEVFFKQVKKFVEAKSYFDLAVDNDFVRLPYTEGVKILEESGHKFEYPVYWGADLQSEHERFLVEEHFKKPVILTDYPKEIKAFYMKMNDDGKTVRAMDVLFPRIGEIIGGSQREENYDKLLARIEELHIPMKDMWWYLDTRRFGTAPHSGFGLGFERLLLFVTGMTNIRDVIPFPRTPKNAEF